MAKWMVKLEGDSLNLHCLHNQISTGDLSVINLDGSYYLISSELDKLITENEVINHCRNNLIPKINECMKFYSDSYEDLSLPNVVSWFDENGIRHDSTFIFPGSAVSRSRFGNPTITLNGEEILRAPSQVDILIRLCNSDKNVREALRFFSKQTWVDLYKVYEIISADLGDKKKIQQNNWESKDNIKRFTCTAQNPKFIGEEARHARMGGEPSKDMSMTKEEAIKMIKSIMDNWINQKIR